MLSNTSEKLLLLKAAHEGDLQQVKSILQKNLGLINYQNSEGRSALINAAWNNHTDVVKYLIEQGANLELVTYEGTALQCAASYGYYQSIELLLKNNAAIDSVSKSGKTALVRVVKEDDREKYLLSAKTLIKHGANINFQDADGNSILQNTNNNQIFDCLLEHKVNVNSVNPLNGRTPLLTFCKKPDKSNLYKIQKLIAHGANINSVDKEGNSALDLLLNSVGYDSSKEAIALLLSAKTPAFDEALKNKAIQKIIKSKSAQGISLVFELGLPLPKSSFNETLYLLYQAKKFSEITQLLEKTSPPLEKNGEEAIDAEGNTLLMRTIIDEQSVIAEKLIPFSLLNTRNKKDQSALDLAIERRSKLFETLLNAGANPNEKDKNGKPILDRYSYITEFAIKLINHPNIDLSYTNKEGDTYLIKFIKGRETTLVKLLLEKNKLNINVRGAKALTPLFITVYDGTYGHSHDYVEIIKALLQAGADPFISCHNESRNIKQTAYELGYENHAFGHLLQSYQKPEEQKKSVNAQQPVINNTPSPTSHILVSDSDNPAFAYSISIISVLSKNKDFNNKGMYGIDRNGEQTLYTNGVDVKHYLIKDCSAEEFSKAMLQSDKVKSAIAFRVVSPECVVKKPLTYGAWPRNKVDLDKVRQSPCISTTSMEKSLTNEISKLKIS